MVLKFRGAVVLLVEWLRENETSSGELMPPTHRSAWIRLAPNSGHPAAKTSKCNRWKTS